ncbi:MAG: methionyl-tRNA formyltransferase [Bacteroidales bacterium]|nr:methionyl-tRNA formyltransferase [Bacteroidales bacterium]
MTGKELNIVFMGTPEFAVASLRRLVDSGYRIAGVVTTPDKPAGRGRMVRQSAVKQYALQQGLPVLQPEKLKSPEFIRQLAAWKADLQVVVAFRMLPEAVWAMPRIGTFNLHASLLPQYRGAAPINRAIINGEPRTGVTTFMLDYEIDTGKILFQEAIDIAPDDTAGDIHDRLMDIGASLVLKTVDAIGADACTPVSQSQLVTGTLHAAPKIFHEDCRIDWTCSGNKIRNLIRGLSPYPAAWTELHIGGTLLQMKVFAAEFVPCTAPAPATVDSDGKKHLKVAAADGWLSLTDIQIAGKKRMPIDEALRGLRI